MIRTQGHFKVRTAVRGIYSVWHKPFQCPSSDVTLDPQLLLRLHNAYVGMQAVSIRLSHLLKGELATSLCYQPQGSKEREDQVRRLGGWLSDGSSRHLIPNKWPYKWGL